MLCGGPFGFLIVASPKLSFFPRSPSANPFSRAIIRVSASQLPPTSPYPVLLSVTPRDRHAPAAVSRPFPAEGRISFYAPSLNILNSSPPTSSVVRGSADACRGGACKNSTRAKTDPPPRQQKKKDQTNKKKLFPSRWVRTTRRDASQTPGAVINLVLRWRRLAH